MANVTYYFDSKSTSVWEDSEDMIDGDPWDPASTENDGDTEVLNGNTCPGTDLGTISKVEIRVYAGGDGDDRVDITPVFGGVDDGDEHQTTPVDAVVYPGDWGDYQDITTDTNAPSPWSWTDIQNLDCKVKYTSVPAGDKMLCSKIEIRVTYTPPPAANPLTGKPLIGHNVIKKAILR